MSATSGISRAEQDANRGTNTEYRNLHKDMTDRIWEDGSKSAVRAERFSIGSRKC